MKKIATVSQTGTSHYVCGDKKTLTSKDFKVECDWCIATVRVEKYEKNAATVAGMRMYMEDIDNMIAVLKETKKILKMKIKGE